MLQRKVKKAVAPYDDAVVGGLRELSEFYGANTAAARRGLRGAIERRGLAINRELLGAFEPLLRELDAVDAEKPVVLYIHQQRNKICPCHEGLREI